MQALARLDEWWRRVKPLNDPLGRDHLFSSYVIHPKFRRAVALYYQKQSFCVLSQLLARARPKVEAKLLRIQDKHPELEWDMAAAIVPLEALAMAFSTAPGRSIDDCLRNPLTLLGLAEHPWNFQADKDYLRLLKDPGHEHRDFFMYDPTLAEQEEMKARWKEKKAYRQELQKEQPKLFHPKGNERKKKKKKGA